MEVANTEKHLFVPLMLGCDEKQQNFLKKGLTFEGGLGIIYKLPRAGARGKTARHLENYIVQTNKKRNEI
jgi:hypothetical protein